MSSISSIPRRIVTGEKDGKSCIIEDGIVDNVNEEIPGLIISDIWTTNTMPVDIDKQVKIANTLFPKIPTSGSYFRYVVIPPDSELGPKLGVTIRPNEPHPLMHKTATIDYIIILSGELYLIMEEGETLLKPGDIVIQRATNHAWSNRSNQPCIQLAILLDARS